MLGEGLIKAGCEKQRVCEIGIVPAAAKCYLLYSSRYSSLPPPVVSITSMPS